MKNKIKGLLYLRLKQITSNLYQVVNVFLPYLLVVILNATINESKMLNDYICQLGLSLVLVLTVGPATSALVSYEKEYYVIDGLKLIGVKSYEYALSSLTQGIIYSILALFILPIIVYRDVPTWYNYQYFIIYILTSFLVSGVYYLIAILSRNQAQSQIISNILMLVVAAITISNSDLKLVTYLKKLLPTNVINTIIADGMVSKKDLSILIIATVCVFAGVFFSTHIYFNRKGDS